MNSPTNAVLRAVDQRAERAPTTCVKTGQPTQRAVRVPAVALPHAETWQAVVGATLTWGVAVLLRQPTARVILAVSDGAWHRWRRRLAVVLVVAMLGGGAIVAGAAREEPGVMWLGLLLLVLSWWLRLRAWRTSWVGLQLRPRQDDILVTRVHPAFSDDARRIYIQSIRRR